MRRLATVIILTACAASAQVRNPYHAPRGGRFGLEAKSRTGQGRGSTKTRPPARCVWPTIPFDPKIAAGSGLAYSSGIPMSIEGSTPSVFQAQASKFVFNRQQTHLVAEAREDQRGVAITTAAKREEIALRAALAYLEAERAARIADLLQRRWTAWSEWPRPCACASARGGSWRPRRSVRT